jgi:predicted ATPase
MAEAAVRRFLPKDEQIVMAWIGSVVGLVGLKKMTSSKAPEVPVVKKAASTTDFGGLEDIPELGEALGAKPQSKAVTRIVLTGGPCGGKSSAAKKMQTELTKDGFDVYFAPEVPTILITGGCLPQLLNSFAESEKGNSKPLVDFETNLLGLQIQQEDSFNNIAASSGQKSVVFYDRGTMDVPAYLKGGREGNQWKSVLEANGFSEDELINRYDMVLHLVTAADGAEKFYTTENNAARIETPDEARALDRKMEGCWKGSNFRKIDNSTGFAEKLQRCVEAVKEVAN